jgi:quinol monooxygenase YgiN
MDERIVRIAELEIVPTLLLEYLALLREEIEASLEREEGVLMLHAVSEQAAPNRIRLLEVYVSRAAYEAHITTPHFLKYKQGTLHMVTSLRLIDVDPVLFAAR